MEQTAPLSVRIKEYLRTLAPHVRQRDSAILLAEAGDELTDRWIPVSERLPDHHGTVVCRTQDRQLQFGRLMTTRTFNTGDVTETHQWRGYPDCSLAVTHWMPLPEPPTT